MIYAGTAGWTIPKEHAARFPTAGSHLERYAQRLPACEINSSFYRPHRPATYARWADAVPEQFHFAVKMPRQITHVQRLVSPEVPLDQFLKEVQSLGTKLGPLLVQLPPSLTFNMEVVTAFFAAIRERFAGGVVCEPRHPSWFQPESEQVLIRFQIGRVAADPATVPAAAVPGGWEGLVYYRMHGSPQMYYSAYSDESLASLTNKLNSESASAPVWCIFDNTALGAATVDALSVAERLLPTVG